MGFIKRTYVGPRAAAPSTKDGTNKFTDTKLNEFFYQLNEVLYHKNKELRNLYGFYMVGTIAPFIDNVSYTSYDIKKIASGKFNAYAYIYAITDSQRFNDPEVNEYSKDNSAIPEELKQKFAEKNCKRFIEIINEFLSKSNEFKNIEAILMNSSFPTFKIPGYGVDYTTVVIKFKYKKIG